MRNGRQRVSIIAAAVITGLVGCGCKKADQADRDTASSRRPNIVLITIESLRHDHVGCYGYDRTTTPTLDALAGEGIAFDNVYSVTSWTLAAHASLFTGLYPTAANIIYPKDRLHEAYTTLAELLADGGYDTAAVVSGTYLLSKFKLDQGFAAYDDSIAQPPGGKRVSIGDVTNPQMEEALLDYFDKRGQTDRPFFLFAYFWDPHYDYIPPEPYDKMFVPSDAKPISLAHYDGQKNPVKKGISPQELAYVISQYDGEIRCTDDVLGRVFQKMKDRGLWDNTVVIVTADHGEEFFEHDNKGHKNNVFAESVRIPLIIKPAQATAARRDDRLASLVDLFPTILDFADVEGDLHLLQGYSLLDEPVGQPVYCELTTSWYFRNKKTGEKWKESDLWLSIRQGQHRVVGMKNDKKNKKRWQLFDVIADPGEQSPLGADQTDLQLEMKSRVRKWYEYMKQLAATIGERGEADLSPAELERLRGLGYIE